MQMHGWEMVSGQRSRLWHPEGCAFNFELRGLRCMDQRDPERYLGQESVRDPGVTLKIAV